jgi:pilus assembly protein Flp/PilA
LGYTTFGRAPENPAGKEETTMLYLPKEKGQGLVEYALILVLVAVVVIVILALLGPAIGNVFSQIVNQI